VVISSISPLSFSIAVTRYRFCTTRWKVDPQRKAINSILEKHTAYIAVVGMRSEESEDRKRRLERLEVKDVPHMKKHETAGCSLYTPIEDWTTDEVWEYIVKHSSDWIDSDALTTMYAEAMGMSARRFSKEAAEKNPVAAKAHGLDALFVQSSEVPILHLRR